MIRTLANSMLAATSIAATLRMAADSGDGAFLSLTDLASFSTDDIETLTSRSYIAGIATVEGKSVALSQQESKKEGEPPLFVVKFSYEVLAFTPTDKKQIEQAEKMVGREIRDSYTIWPKDLVESLGLLKGRYQKAGIQNSGLPVGGVEGQEPGWLDMMIGGRFDVKISTYKDNAGETRNRFDWAKSQGSEEIA